MWPEILAAVFALLAAALGFLLFRAMRREGSLREELGGLKAQDAANLQALAELRAGASEADTLRTEAARLETALEHERRGADEKIRLLEAAEERLKKEFENLAGRILDEKGTALSEQNREKLSAVLQPLKEQLDAFRKRVDDVHTEDSKQSQSLIEQIRHLQELSTQVSKDADNLARAIKGDAKARGNWGELVVRRLLESAGLVEGRHFEAQKAYTDENGARLVPDFIVNLPGDRAVVLDSKVSLVAYERFASQDDADQAGKDLKEHIASVRSHIAELRAKAYENLLGDRTLDFVMMCIPVEPAFQAAMNADPELQYDAAGGNVVVTGPVTLLLMLKLVAQFWRRDDEARNTREIADRASAIYDKARLLAESIEKSRIKAAELTQAIDDSFGRLSAGPGNLIRQVEMMRRLGLKVKTPIPTALVDRAMSDSLDEPQVVEPVGLPAPDPDAAGADAPDDGGPAEP